MLAALAAALTAFSDVIGGGTSGKSDIVVARNLEGGMRVVSEILAGGHAGAGTDSPHVLRIHALAGDGIAAPIGA